LTGAFVFLHTFGARALVAFAVLLGIWGAYGYFRNAQVSGGFRSSYLIMAGLTAVQGLFGLALLVTGNPPSRLLHVVYGIFAVLFLLGAYLWAHGGSKRREAVILAAAAWIVAVAYFRGISTG